jgi:hypothetical protein
MSEGWLVGFSSFLLCRFFCFVLVVATFVNNRKLSRKYIKLKPLVCGAYVLHATIGKFYGTSHK